MASFQSRLRRGSGERCTRVLREAGFRVEPFRPSTLEPLRKLWWKFFVQCGAMFYEPEIRNKRAKLSPIFREFLGIAEAAGPLNATELLNAWAELDLLARKDACQRCASIRFCFVRWPASPHFDINERIWTIEGSSVEYLDAMRFTQWFNTLACSGGGGSGGHIARRPSDRCAD